MADTHEEQLLSDLLGDVAREDERLEAPHLEARILASASLPERARRARSRAWVMWPVAAAAVLAIAVNVRPEPGTTDSAAQESTEVTLAGPPPAPVPRQPESAQESVRSVRLQPDRSVRVPGFSRATQHVVSGLSRTVNPPLINRRPQQQLYRLPHTARSNSSRFCP